MQPPVSSAMLEKHSAELALLLFRGVGALCFVTYGIIEISVDTSVAKSCSNWISLVHILPAKVGALSSFRFGFCSAEPFRCLCMFVLQVPETGSSLQQSGRSEEHCPKGQWASISSLSTGK